MKIGLFTDTYFPQVSGVATSIKTLKDELESRGHEVIIFTTTDPSVVQEDPSIIRLRSIPFISFTDRRIVISGMKESYDIARDMHLDIIHTQTEFGTGWLGKYIAKKMGIPIVHTYHTMYEDYLHYIARGKIIKPSHVRQATRTFTRNLSGIICPSQRVVDKMEEYQVKAPLKVIPTGVNLSQFHLASSLPITKSGLLIREQYGIDKQAIVLLSLSRISYEKNIQAIIEGLPRIIESLPQVKLLVVGKGPYQEELQELAVSLDLVDYVIFTGEVPNELVGDYYQTADFFVSASSSESQGLTYIEALASGTKVVTKSNDYVDHLFSSDELGTTFFSDADFAETFIHYFNVAKPLQEETYQKKLFEISSEHFADEVLEFYDLATKYHQIYCELKVNHHISDYLKGKKPRKFSLRRNKNE